MQKTGFIFSILFVGLMTSQSFGQLHSDIEFGYVFDTASNPTGFEIEGTETTSEGVLLFEAELDGTSAFNPDDVFAVEPGVETNPGEGLVVGAGDQIFLTPVNAAGIIQAGAGFVNFYDLASDSITASGRFGISTPNFGGPEVILNGASVESALGIDTLVGTADPTGFFHTDPRFDLEDDQSAATGAYGVLFELNADFADENGDVDGVFDLTSDPFLIVFNNGLDEIVFEEQAVAAFVGGPASIPEPAAGVLLSGMLGSLLLRRRRRS